MYTELLKDGFLVLLIGMGSVYLFIYLMVWVMNGMAKLMTIINKYFPEEIEKNKYERKKTDKTNEAEIALAICCAAAKRGRAC